MPQAPDVVPAGAHFGAPPQSYQQPPQVGRLSHPQTQSRNPDSAADEHVPCRSCAPVKLPLALESCPVNPCRSIEVTCARLTTRWKILKTLPVAMLCMSPRPRQHLASQTVLADAATVATLCTRSGPRPHLEALTLLADAARVAQSGCGHISWLPVCSAPAASTGSQLQPGHACTQCAHCFPPRLLYGPRHCHSNPACPVKRVRTCPAWIHDG